MGTQTDVLAGHGAGDVGHCSAESCSQPAVAQFEARSLCMEHFTSTSIRELESRGQVVRSAPSDPTATETFKQLLANCASQVKELVESEQLSQLPGKERLLDILLLISQLNQQLRRSPRTATSVPLWLRREDPGQTWEEETWTSSISQHGAGLICRHRVEPGRTLYLCRRDKGGRARARVVYSRFDSCGDRQIGVEILDRDDFWDPAELARDAETRESKTPAQPIAETAEIRNAQGDVEVQVGGQTVIYKQIPVQITTQGKETRVSATIGANPLNLRTDASGSKESAESTPVRIELVWRNEK